MSAARVLNPVVLSELCKIGASPSSMGRSLSCGRQLTRVKRDLFGPVNPVENNKIFTEEVEKQQEKAMKKWGFDFRSGSPLANNKSQFIWERVSFQESNYAPEVYTLTRSAHLRPIATDSTSMDLLMDERSERENSIINSAGSSNDTDSCDESHDETELVFKLPTMVPSAISPSSLTYRCGRSYARKRQPKITEFMKERKRLAQTPKKLSPPAKRLRTSSASSNVDCVTTRSAHAQHMNAHFHVRK